MKLGVMLGIEAQQVLDRVARRNGDILQKQRRKAREAELNRRRSRGELIRYSNEV